MGHGQQEYISFVFSDLTSKSGGEGLDKKNDLSPDLSFST